MDINAWLDTEEQRIREALTEFDEDVELRRWDGHDLADMANAVLLRHEASAFATSCRKKVRQITDTRRRIADGVYGICEECRGPIPDERLEALPMTPRCTRCAA